MKIDNDKLLHARAGLLVAVACVAAWTLLRIALQPWPDLAMWAPIQGAPLAGALGATVAGLVKEKADALDNAQYGPMHEVSTADVLATALPGWVLCAALAAFLQWKVW